MVAIEPILGSIKYKARSHYHPVLSQDHIHSRDFCGTVSRKVIYRANVQSARTKMDRDKRVDLLGGEDVTPIIKSSQDVDGSQRNQCQFSICPTL